MTRQRDLWSLAGIWIVGVTAAVWSFTALSNLAERVGIDTASPPILGVSVHTSWGLPITVDVLAIVATRVWLRGQAPADAIRYAQRLAWAAIVASIGGNAYHGLLMGGRFDALLVSTVPAVVIGAMVHLAVLVGRPQSATSDTASAGEDTTADHQPTTSEPPAAPVETVIEHVNALADPPPASPEPPAPRVLTLAQPHPDVVTARRLLRERVGRPTLCRELRIGDNSAKTLQKMTPDAVTHDLLVEWQGREAAAEERRRA
jgi:hypothetical protein